MGIPCLLPGVDREVPVASRHHVQVVPVFALPDFQTHLPQAREGVEPVEFRLRVRLEESHWLVVGCSARLFPSLIFSGLIGYID